MALHPLPGNIRLLNLILGSDENQWCFELQPSRYSSHHSYRLQSCGWVTRYSFISLNHWHLSTQRYKLDKSEFMAQSYPPDRLVSAFNGYFMMIFHFLQANFNRNKKGHFFHTSMLVRLKWVRIFQTLLNCVCFPQVLHKLLKGFRQSLLKQPIGSSLKMLYF